MLPDFPGVKGRMRCVLQQRMRRTVYRETAILSQMRRFQSHEGHTFTIHRLDGSVDRNRYRKTIVEFQIDKKDLATLPPKDLLEKIERAALEMAGKTSKTVFDKLRAVTSETGNVLDAKGRPFSSDTFLEGLEMIDMDFDDQGRPTGLTIVMGPELAERIKVLGPQWEADPEFKRRYEALLERKREAWRDRENRRKLAD